MRSVFLHFASLVWFVHAVFGASFHHTHPGAELCSATPGQCKHACHLHDHDHAAEHGHASHSKADPQHAADPQQPAEPDHSCPGHHHGDDGSSGFVSVGAGQLVNLLVQSLTAENWLPPADEPSLVCDEYVDLHRGPPLRCHLVLGVLLI